MGWGRRQKKQVWRGGRKKTLFGLSPQQVAWANCNLIFGFGTPNLHTPNACHYLPLENEPGGTATQHLPITTRNMQNNRKKSWYSVSIISSKFWPQNTVHHFCQPSCLRSTSTHAQFSWNHNFFLIIKHSDTVLASRMPLLRSHKIPEWKIPFGWEKHQQPKICLCAQFTQIHRTPLKSYHYTYLNLTLCWNLSEAVLSETSYIKKARKKLKLNRKQTFPKQNWNWTLPLTSSGRHEYSYTRLQPTLLGNRRRQRTQNNRPTGRCNR